MDETNKIIGQAVDCFGVTWEVYRQRPTSHGFEILLGHPPGAAPYGQGSVILTEALANYLRRHVRTLKVDLPLSGRVIYNLRRRLGIFARIDLDAWWRERMDDLLSLSPSEFAKRHGVSATTASYSRRKYLGEIRTRELGTPPSPPFPWTPELDALLGTDSDLAIARKTGISPQAVRYRRKKLRIPSKPSGRFAMWTPEQDALLGTDSDEAIANRLGIGIGQVRYRRLKLGIKPYVRHRRLKDGYHLFADNHLMEKINSLEPHLIERFRGFGVPIKTLKAVEIIEAAIDYMLGRAEKGELREQNAQP